MLHTILWFRCISVVLHEYLLYEYVIGKARWNISFYFFQTCKTCTIHKYTWKWVLYKNQVHISVVQVKPKVSSSYGKNFVEFFNRSLGSSQQSSLTDKWIIQSPSGKNKKIHLTSLNRKNVSKHPDIKTNNKKKSVRIFFYRREKMLWNQLAHNFPRNFSVDKIMPNLLIGIFYMLRVMN